MTSYERWWRAADLTPTPWRNGGGTTYEVAREPADAAPDDFDWRVSIASVAGPGPFSAFPGVDRVIVLIDGSSMILTIDGAVVPLQPRRPVAFAGESETWCELPDGPTRDLNLMTRRGVVYGTLACLEAPVDLPAAWCTVLVALAGPVEVDGVRLDPLDGLVRAEAPLSVRGPGSIAVIRLSPTGS